MWISDLKLYDMYNLENFVSAFIVILIDIATAAW